MPQAQGKVSPDWLAECANLGDTLQDVFGTRAKPSVKGACRQEQTARLLCAPDMPSQRAVKCLCLWPSQPLTEYSSTAWLRQSAQGAVAAQPLQSPTRRQDGRTRIRSLKACARCGSRHLKRVLLQHRLKVLTCQHRCDGVDGRACSRCIRINWACSLQ